MYIFSLAAIPNGTEVSYHRIQRMEIDTVAKVVVNSYSSETSEMVVWQGTHEMPLSFLTNYPTSVFEWLVSETGPFVGGILFNDPSDLELTKGRLIKGIEKKRDQYISGGITTPHGVVDSGTDSIRNIMGSYQSAVSSIVLQQPFSIEWRLKNNTMVTLDAMQMIAIGDAVLAHTKACYQRSWELKALVNDEDVTIGELHQLPLTEGWPS